MSSAPLPNDEIAELAAVLGEDNVRTLVRTFLRDFPASFAELSAPGERRNHHRIAHSMKSNTRLMGAHALSARMAALENRLEQTEGGDISAEDLMMISRDFEAFVGPLRAFVGT